MRIDLGLLGCVLLHEKPIEHFLRRAVVLPATARTAGFAHAHRRAVRSNLNRVSRPPIYPAVSHLVRERLERVLDGQHRLDEIVEPVRCLKAGVGELRLDLVEYAVGLGEGVWSRVVAAPTILMLSGLASRGTPTNRESIAILPRRAESGSTRVDVDAIILRDSTVPVRVHDRDLTGVG